MGKVNERKIELIRSYLDPDREPIPSFDYDLIYPITTYAAIHRSLSLDSTTLDQELESIYNLIKEKQDLVEAGIAGNVMTWSGTKGKIGSIAILREINDDPTLRKHTNLVSERAVGNALDLKANASVVNEHLDNANIHLTEDEKTKLNNAASEEVLNEHMENSEIHVTAEEKEYWNAKASADDIGDHLNNTNNPHYVTAHQVGTYTRDEVDEMFASIRATFFNYRNIEYNPSTGVARLVEYVSSNWNPNYVLSYGADLPDVTDPSLTYFALRPVTDYSTNETQECMIYVKNPGEVWKEAGLQTMTAGDMVIRYPDTTMCVWVQGRFIMLFTDSSGDGSGSNMMWRPTLSADGILGWTRSSETTPPDPISIKGQDGTTPQKGVDYFDGAPGVGVPEGGTTGDLMVKVTSADYDCEWMSFEDFVDRYYEEGGEIPSWILDWNKINNRPEILQELGDNDFNLLSQKYLTTLFTNIGAQINEIMQVIGGEGGLEGLTELIKSHIGDYDNPHRLSAATIGAVDTGTFSAHASNASNPHNVTAAQIGLGNVNNTADVDKPISNAAKVRFDSIDEAIEGIKEILDVDKMINEIIWDENNVILTFVYKDGNKLECEIPVLSIFRSLTWDKEKHELVVTLPSGEIHEIPITDLVIDYTGSVGKHIKIEVVDGVIKGTIIPDSITGDEIEQNVHLRNSPTTTTQGVTDKTDKIATTKFVKDVVINDLIHDDEDRPLSAYMGKRLGLDKTSVEDVIEMIADTPLVNITDNLQSTDPYSALSANMGRELNLTKAPKVHTSSASSTFGRATEELFGHARASSLDPLIDAGEGDVGTDNGYYARGDHRHPVDLTRAPLHFPDQDHGITRLEGEPKAVTPNKDSNDERIATTEWVNNKISEYDTEGVEDLRNRMNTAETNISNIETNVGNIDSRVSKCEDKLSNVFDYFHFRVNENGDLILSYEEDDEQ